MKNGFVTLIGLLIAVLIITFIVWGIGKNDENPKGQIDTYNKAIKDAENIKNVLENR